MDYDSECYFSRQGGLFLTDPRQRHTTTRHGVGLGPTRLRNSEPPYLLRVRSPDPMIRDEYENTNEFLSGVCRFSAYSPFLFR